VRAHLCTSLAKVFCHGFKADSYSLWLMGKNHFWYFIENFKLDEEKQTKNSGHETENGMNHSEKEIVILSHNKSLREINENDFLQIDENRRFRAWICSALNKKRLLEWLKLYVSDNEHIESYYNPEAIWFDAQACDQMFKIVQNFSKLQFKLSLNYEKISLKKEKSAN